jgi:type IV fimbrial biogenesis protein FimT
MAKKRQMKECQMIPASGFSSRGTCGMRGFTLIEVLVVMAIAGILAIYAIPSFQHMMYESQVSSRAAALVADLRLAKTEAVRRGASVTLTVASNGWKVCVGDATATCTDTTTLREHEGSTNVTVDSTNLTEVTYGARGRRTDAAVATTKMSLAHSKDATIYRCIDVQVTGALEVLRPGQGTC